VSGSRSARVASLTIVLVVGLLAGAMPTAHAAVGDIVEFPVQANAAPEGIATGPDGNIWFVESATKAIGRIAPDGTGLQEFPLTGINAPLYITAGPDGNMWFTATGVIARIAMDGTVTPFALPTGGFPQEITAGPDGNLWFVDNFRNNVGTIEPQAPNTITLYPIPSHPGGGTTSSQPIGIAAGPDGNMWFTESHPMGSKIGVVTTSGTFLHEYPTTTAGSRPGGITLGPDGNLWFAETDATANRIAKITPAGAITEYPVTTANAQPLNVAVGADGLVWFSESNSSVSAVARTTTTGTITEYHAPTQISSPYGIALGPDGNLWSPERAKAKVARAEDAAAKTSYVLDLASGFAPGTRGSAAGSTVQWSFLGAKAAEVADASGMGLFDSGSKLPGTSFSFVFVGAGAYKYKDALGTAKGTVKVPMKVQPTSGGPSTPFTVTWASGTAPAGFLYDVQIQRPGSGSFVDWQVGVTAKSTTFTPDAGVGVYQFHARLRKVAGGKASGYSAAKKITVSSPGGAAVR
jgi:streptogramin lyase